MKIKVFGTPEKKEKVLNLRLFQEDGAVVVKAVNDNGEPLLAGYILSINDKGILVHSHVDDAVKLPKDEKDRVVVTKE
jgi:hypothetical protein